MKKYLAVIIFILLVTSCQPIVVLSFNAILGLSIIFAIFFIFGIYLVYLWIVEKFKAAKKYIKNLFRHGKKSN